MRVQDVMTHEVSFIYPDESVQKAAKRMAELDVGALPVAENDRLVGMLTDRDIALRVVAAGASPSTKVRQVMTPQVKYCFVDQEVDEIVGNMADIQIRRLPVMTRDKRLVGILSLCDIATSDDADQVVFALGGISRPANGSSPLAG